MPFEQAVKRAAGYVPTPGDAAHGRFDYDPIGRITASRLDSRHGLQSAPHETFHWDPASNPVPEPFMGRHGLALPDNRLTVWQDTRYTYDTHGNL